jgi:tRNA(fMet)-specific endonuclease VapC
LTGLAYLLDTSIIAEMVRNPTGRAAQRARQCQEQICTSIIVACELRYLCARQTAPDMLRKVESMLNEIEILPLESPADVDYGVLRAELDSAGQVIDAHDLLIAVHAHSLKLTLVTAQLQAFSQIRGLLVENWSVFRFIGSPA